MCPLLLLERRKKKEKKTDASHAWHNLIIPGKPHKDRPGDGSHRPMILGSRMVPNLGFSLFAYGSVYSIVGDGTYINPKPTLKIL